MRTPLAGFMMQLHHWVGFIQFYNENFGGGKLANSRVTRHQLHQKHDRTCLKLLSKYSSLAVPVSSVLVSFHVFNLRDTPSPSYLALQEQEGSLTKTYSESVKSQSNRMIHWTEMRKTRLTLMQKWQTPQVRCDRQSRWSSHHGCSLDTTEKEGAFRQQVSTSLYFII
jgi:hypothetical protein